MARLTSLPASRVWLTIGKYALKLLIFSTSIEVGFSISCYCKVYIFFVFSPPNSYYLSNFRKKGKLKKLKELNKLKELKKLKTYD